MTVQTVLAIALLVSAVIGAAYSVGKAGVWLWRTLRALARLADDLTGEPDRPGAPGRKGILDRIELMEGHIGGFDLRLVAIEQRLAHLDVFEQHLNTLESRLAVLEASLAPTEHVT